MNLWVFWAACLLLGIVDFCLMTKALLALLAGADESGRELRPGELLEGLLASGAATYYG